MRSLSCSMWDLVPWPGVEPRPRALAPWSLRHWTTLGSLWLLEIYILLWASCFSFAKEIIISLPTVVMMPKWQPVNHINLCLILQQWTLSALFLSKTLYSAFTNKMFSSVQFSHSVVSDSLRPHESQHTRPLSITNSRTSLRLTSIESMIPSSHLILCHPLFLLPPIPPSIRVFSNESTLSWGGQRIGVSALASFLPKNTQDWFPLGWTGWISLQSKGLPGVFSNTTVQKHQFFGAQLSS